MAIVEPVDTAEGAPRRFELRCPIDLAPIGELTCATAEDVRDAVVRARAAQRDWAQRTFTERAEPMWRLLDLFVQRREDIVAAVVRETGKARAEALAMEVYAPCDSISYYAKNAAKFLAPEKRRVHGLMGLAKKLRIVYRPLGVVGLITPWNGPVALAVNPTVQALMAGNAVVHKPSEVTPFSAELVRELFVAAGIPADLYQVVQGDGRTGAALIEAGVDKVSFTGSVATGRRVGEACGRMLIPCTLELGGKDAMIVCADADLERAADGAVFGSCMNTGHYCCGTERIYAVEPIFEPLVERVVAKVAALRQSDHGETDVGAVFWDRQLEIIESHVEDARARGAKVLVGGRRNPNLGGLYYEPTVLVDVDPSMRIMREETFGPIVAIVKVASEEEALRLANDSEYGLNGNVWTADVDKGLRIAASMETGGVCINDPAITYGIPEAPFGGIKASGVGQVNGATGLRGYCHALPISIDRRGKGPIQGGFPYTARSTALLDRIIRYYYGTRLCRWFA